MRNGAQSAIVKYFVCASLTKRDVSASIIRSAMHKDASKRTLCSSICSWFGYGVQSLLVVTENTQAISILSFSHHVKTIAAYKLINAINV